MSEFNPETAKAIALAISDPGATTPRMPGENVTSWSTRAVHRIIAHLIHEAEQLAWDTGYREGAERVAARVGLEVDTMLADWPTQVPSGVVREWIRAALTDGTP